jgi:peptidoglycan/xylan/chitin deacetylase (PgdA/CDA1 family)
MNLMVRPPQLFRQVYPGATWRMSKTEKKIYLTFDDGPVPGITTEALSVLKQAGIHATFFCVGENVKRYSEIFQQIVAGGHAVGNHTMHHLDGWKHTWFDYMRDVKECAAAFSTNLFRPPYGHMRRSQFNTLSRHCRVVMWDVLTYDFDKTYTREHCLELALMYSREGSIVVFHDSEKAKERMLYALPRYIEEMQARGFTFGKLDEEAAPTRG